MNSSDVPPTRLRLAVALSIAAHICALLLLAVLLSDREIALSSETITGPVLFLTSIDHRAPAPPGRAAASPARSVRANGAAKAAQPAPRETTGVAKAAHPAPRETSAAMRTRAAEPSEKLAGGAIPPSSGHAATIRAWATTLSLPHASLALIAPAPTPTPTPAPTPTPVPGPSVAPPAPVSTVAATPAAVAQASFGGLFSQNYPPALAAPADLAGVRSRLSGPVRIRIDVDEAGRATDVRFVRPVADAALAEEIRTTLLALHYVPADCNGLHCEGTLEIAY